MIFRITGPRRSRIKIIFFSAAVLFFSFFMLVSAETEPGAHGEQSHHFNWFHFFGQVFNSTVLFGGLIYLLRKPLIKFLDEKSTNIKIDLEEREDNLARTSQKLAEIKNRLDKIEEEVTQIKKTAQQSGAEEKKKIRELGQQEADRIIRLNEQEISRRVESSIRELKEKIADLTIDHFKNEVKTELDDKLHEKIIEQNIAVMGELIERE